MPFLLHEALIYMIYKGDENGQKGIADTIEILRKMWCEIGEEDLKEWIQRTFILVQSEEILLPEMCESENTNEDTNEQVMVKGACEKNDAEEGLCNMWCNGEVGDTPQRREPDEQLSKELDLLMQKLSFEDAQTEVIMYCLRIACEGKTSVFETLSTVSEGKINGVIALEPGIASREGGHIYEDVSGTLRANAGDNQMSVAYSIENHPADSRVNIDESGKVQTLTSRMGTGGGNVPMVMEQVPDSNYIDVELEVAVRKYEVNCEKLCECLREHKASSDFNNKDIAEKLNRPITEVEHWFRNDKYFSIPDPDIWFDLKNMLGITTTEFDQSIMEFEYKGGNYDMRNRIHIGNTSPTLSCGCGNNLYLVPEIVEGLDCYNQSITGDKSKVLTNSATDSDHIPCVIIDRAAFNQGINAKYDIGIDEEGKAFSLVAKGPGAVCYCVDQGGGKSGANVTEGISPTLTCTHGGEPAVCLETFHCVTTEDGTSFPLKARDYKDMHVICLQGNGIDRADTAGCNGKGWKEGTSYTLNTVDRPAVVYNGENITSPLNKTNPQVGDACHTLTSDSRNYLVETKPHYIVRRLTPMECERLQGYADGWTDIGEYIDSKGKKKKTSDSARYKALGNSIALPPWKWVLKRISSHYERDATLASLFDGIGGFPCLWEQINGKGSCLWASEIEDFPIAVTKERIG